MSFIREWLQRRELRKKRSGAPRTLQEAVDYLDANVNAEDKAEFASEPEDSPGALLHFTLGMKMRNNWGLWDKKQPIAKWFRERGIWHPDDMSAIIYKAFWCKLSNKPFDIEDEALNYSDFWRKTYGMGFDGEHTDKDAFKFGTPLHITYKRK